MKNMDKVDVTGLDLFVRGKKKSLRALLKKLNRQGFMFFGKKGPFKMVLTGSRMSKKASAKLTVRWEAETVSVHMLPMLLQQNYINFASLQLAHAELHEIEYDGSEFYLSIRTTQNKAVMDALDELFQQAA